MAIAYIDQHAHPDAIPWYRSRPAEPGGSAFRLSVTQAIAIPNISLDAVLDRILVNPSRGADLIIVGHGREEGLSMRLVAGSASRARADLIRQLASDRGTPDALFGSMPPVPVSRVATLAQITEQQVVQLRMKMNRVRALTLTHVAFRACKLGVRRDVLRAYKPFFGCKVLSAPDLRDTYGTIRHGSPTVNMNQWITQHSPGHHMYVYGTAPNRIAIATSGGEDDDHTYTVDFAYENPTALANWTAQYLGSHRSGAFAYHGQWRTHPRANKPQIVFVGDPDYNEHIVVV